MARVIFAMANSSTTRCGRLLSSAMGRGTALGSTLSAPRCAAPGVATLAASFMGEEVSGSAADAEDGGIESELVCESVRELGATTAPALSDLDCPCDFISCDLTPACLAACLGCGYSSMRLAGL